MIRILCALLKRITTKGTVIYEKNGKYEKIKW